MNILRLKEIREDKDLYQKDIAKLLNITQQQYNKYELGINSIPIEKINILADYYKTSVDYLLCRTDNRKPYEKSIIEDKKRIVDKN
jgi:transcriptional regulator with XRE-family HTH domain